MFVLCLLKSGSHNSTHRNQTNMQGSSRKWINEDMCLVIMAFLTLRLSKLTRHHFNCLFCFCTSHLS